MRSTRGFLAACVFLLAIPLAVVLQAVAGADAETSLHFAFAFGCASLCLAVSDLKTPWWIATAGDVSTGFLAVIFLLQGINDLAHNDALTWIALQVLGQRPESLLIDLMLLWFVGVLFTDPATKAGGKLRTWGFAVVAIAICVKMYGYVLESLGTSLNAEAPALKILLLLPFVWFLFECRKAPNG